jgi:riboflavin kinase/FMN adenylyltransferase
MIIRGYENIPSEFYGSVVALGNFDGVHIGHQEIIKTAIAISNDSGCKVGVVTFDPHPSKVLGSEIGHKLLMDPSKKFEVLLSLGIDFIIVIDFTKDFSLLSADEFIDLVLCKSLYVSQVVTGYNFRFGKNGYGNNKLLASYSKKGKFSYTQVNHIKYFGLEVSTSHIKTLVNTGRINLAADLLGRNYEISGIVSEGRRMAGTLLNTPTANIAFSTDLLLPLFGVYLVKIKLDDGILYWGIANIGVRPTIKNAYPAVLEVNIFDCSKDLYGNQITVFLISLIRPERKFNDLDKLKYAISSDKAFSKYLIKNLS